LVEFPVASKASLEWLNRKLVGTETPGEVAKRVDAFGASANADNDKLPSVKLPIIADVKLRAMNSESSC
jgi:hypothetical protein